MKRILFLVAWMAGLSMSVSATSVVIHPSAVEESELPWSTVDAVLHRVSEAHSYTYVQLVDWYHTGRVTVEQAANGSYWVSICDEDGSLQVLLEESL